MEVTLRKTQADVVASDGAVVCTFERQPGGLFVAKLVEDRVNTFKPEFSMLS